jgi:flagellar hook protein FlgE
VQLDGITIDAETGRISGTTKDTDEWITIGFLAVGNVTNPNGLTHEGGFYYKAGDGAGDLQISMLGGVEKELLTNFGTMAHINGSLYAAAAAAAGLDPDTAVQSDLMVLGSAGTTELVTGGLEGSNVDLATEISDMITTQRGYQANTRIITVTDTMLEELVNMKR